MTIRSLAAALTFVLVPCLASAQDAPVAKAFREFAAQEGKNLIAAAELMPAAKYTFKPTPAQMSFADIMQHLAMGNDYLCGAIGGAKAPQRPSVAATASKDALVARLKETFAFCDQALASLDDSKLTEQLPMFGGKTMTRAAVETLTVGDWADHYSQVAIYLRLNGQLPPSAKKPGA
jgi:DinB family protein